MDQVVKQPFRSAWVSLLIGFVGSIFGLVYAWPYVFDRIWFLAWLVVAGLLFVIACMAWITAANTSPSAEEAKSRTLEENVVSRHSADDI